MATPLFAHEISRSCPRRMLTASNSKYFALQSDRALGQAVRAKAADGRSALGCHHHYLKSISVASRQPGEFPLSFRASQIPAGARTLNPRPGVPAVHQRQGTPDIFLRGLQNVLIPG